MRYVDHGLYSKIDSKLYQMLVQDFYWDKAVISIFWFKFIYITTSISNYSISRLIRKEKLYS